MDLVSVMSDRVLAQILQKQTCYQADTARNIPSSSVSIFLGE